MDVRSNWVSWTSLSNRGRVTVGAPGGLGHCSTTEDIRRGINASEEFGSTELQELGPWSLWVPVKTSPQYQHLWNGDSSNHKWGMIRFKKYLLGKNLPAVRDQGSQHALILHGNPVPKWCPLKSIKPDKSKWQCWSPSSPVTHFWLCSHFSHNLSYCWHCSAASETTFQ